MFVKKIISTALLIIFLVINFSFVTASFEKNQEITVIYFYTSTCSTCQKLEPFFNELKYKYKNLTIIEYNILNLKNKNLMDKYNEAYNVIKSDEGKVPVVFLKNMYFTGVKSIKDNLERVVTNQDEQKTLEINDFSPTHNNDKILSLGALTIFSAGLINGINPCSMSMLLFFLSLIIVRKVNIMRIGISFCIGKFVAYLFLGTIFFGLLSKINIGWLHVFLKLVMLLTIIVLIVLNLQDFYAAKNEKYNKIRLQLPSALRRFNHNLIKRLSGITNLKLLFGVSFVLGIIISLGEFMCTGQIYLTTIVTVLHTNTSMSLQAFFYLVLYGLGFIIPLIIVTFIIYKGREVFEVAEFIRAHMCIVKFVNVFVFAIFGFIIVFF